MIVTKRFPAAAISAVMLLQSIGVATAAASPGPQLSLTPPSAKIASSMAKARGERVALEALAALRAKKVQRGDMGGFTPSDGGPNEKQLYGENETVRVIIQLTGQSAAEKLAAQGNSIQSASANEVSALTASAKTEREAAIAAAKGRGIDMKMRHTYDVALNGFSAEMRFGDVQKLRRVPGVRNVTVAKRFYPNDNFSTEMIGATALWNENPAVDGTGMVIAIIDTGIDYRHPELGGQSSLDPNGKVVGGHNWADNNDQVLDYGGSSHGTHVAGIAAGTGEGPKQVKGVAPKAKLLAQKVFSNDPATRSAWTDDLVAAINDSVNPRSPHHPGVVANVLNMSLGAVSGFDQPDDPEQVAIQNAVNAGAVVAISAGNSSFSTSDYYYPYYEHQDIATAGSPGTARAAITVASSQNSHVTVEGRTLLATLGGSPYAGEHDTVYLDGSGRFGAFQTLKSQQFDLAIPSGNELGCSPADWTGVELTGKVALVKRGTCTFQSKADNVAAAGAAAIVVVNNRPDPDITSMATDTATIPTVMVMNNFGTALQQALRSNQTVKVGFNGPSVSRQLADPSSDTISSFSSWGTTPDLKLKPDLAAPGGNIYSSVMNGQYESFNGTSMAAPHVAGAAALVKQAHQAYSPADIKAALMNTGKLLAPGSAANPYSPRQQGSGRIQVDKAVATNVLVTAEDGVASLSLGTIPLHGSKTFTLKVKNTGSAPANFELAGSVFRPSKSGNGFSTLNSATLTGANLSFDANSITVPAGETITVQGTLNLSGAQHPPEAAFGHFAEGFIQFASKTEGQPDLVVPYISYAGEWVGPNSPPIVDPMMNDRLTYTGYTGLYYKMGDSFYQLGATVDGDFNEAAMAINNDPNAGASQDSVYPVLTLLRNARNLAIDVVDEQDRLVERIANEEFVRNLAAQEYYLGWNWDGKKFDRTTGNRQPVSEGQYSLRVRALTPGANPDSDGDWQTYRMPVKVDNTAPTFSADFPLPTGIGPFDLTWSQATDPKNGSGLWGMFAILDDEVAAIATPTESGKITLDITPGPHKNIGLCAMDNADNIDCMIYWDGFEHNDLTAVGDLQIVTNDPYVTLQYTASANVKKVTYTVSESAPEVPQQAGQIQLNLAKDGTYDVYVQAYSDEAGTQKIGELHYVIDVDMSPPLIEITSPAARETYKTPTLKVTGKVTEAHPKAEGVRYSLDEGKTWNALVTDKDGAYAFDATFITEGRKNIMFTGEDTLGNKVEVARVVYIDTKAPVIKTSLDPLTGDAPALITAQVTSRGSYHLSGTTLDATSNYSFSIDGNAMYTTDTLTPETPRAWTYDVPDLAEGPVIVQLIAEDVGSNKAERSLKFVPADKPLVSIESTQFTATGAEITGSVDRTVTKLVINGQPVDFKGHRFTTTVPVNAMYAAVAYTRDPAVVGLDFVSTAYPILKITAPADGLFTKDEKVTVEGTASSPNLDWVKVNGTAVAPTNGTVSAETSLPAEGANTITVEAADKDGTVQAARVQVVRDTQPPVVQLNVPDGLQTQTVTVTGSVTDPNLEKVTLNENPLELNPDGTFTTQLTFETQGKHDAVLVAKDRAGNTTTATKSVTVTSLSGLSLSPTGTWSPNGGKLEITYSLAARSAISLEVWQDGAKQGTITSGTKNAGTYMLPWNGKVNGKPLASGTYEIRLLSGDTFLSAETTIQTTPPENPALDQIPNPTRERNPVLTGTAAGASKVQISISGPSSISGVTADVNADGRFTANLDLSQAKSGTYTVKAVAVDRLGNKSAESKLPFVLDVTAPSKPIANLSGLVNSEFVSTNSAVKVTLKTNEASQFTITKSAGPSAVAPTTSEAGVKKATLPLDTTNLEDGVYTFEVLATDAAGNESEKTTFEFTVDKTAPALEMVESDTATLGQYKVTGTVSDLGAGVDRVTVDGAKANLKDGTFTYNKRLSRLGTVTITVIVYDNAGNSTAKRLTLTVSD